MDGKDLRRRIGWARTEARARAQLTPLWRRPREIAAVTAADCLRAGREPLRRLESLRRRPHA